MPHGDQLFLAATETLQHVLLPHLSAVDLFRLACTSKAMQQWILSTPVNLWQVSEASASQHLQPVLQYWPASTEPCSVYRASMVTLQQHTWLVCRQQSSFWPPCARLGQPGQGYSQGRGR